MFSHVEPGNSRNYYVLPIITVFVFIIYADTRIWNSTWVMMNRQTRRLSKMPEEVRAEISPWFIEKQAIQEEVAEKIVKLDDKAKYVNTNLKVKTSHTNFKN